MPDRRSSRLAATVNAARADLDAEYAASPAVGTSDTIPLSVTMNGCPPAREDSASSGVASRIIRIGPSAFTSKSSFSAASVTVSAVPNATTPAAITTPSSRPCSAWMAAKVRLGIATSRRSYPVDRLASRTVAPAAARAVAKREPRPPDAPSTRMMAPFRSLTVPA